MKSKANIGVIVDLCEKCPDINLQLTAFDGDASTPVSLFVDGILPSDPLYNTWVWERAEKYGAGAAYNTNPIWTSLGTGLITRFAGDDSIVRVRLDYNGCVYYSNVVGYDGDFNSGSTIVTDGTITGNGTLASPLAVNPFNNRIIAKAYAASVILPITVAEALITTNEGFETTTHLVYDTVNNRITNVSGYTLVLRVDYSAFFKYFTRTPPGTIKSFEIYAYKNGTTLLDGLITANEVKEDNYNLGSIAKSDYIQLGNNDYIVFKYTANADVSLQQLTILAEQVAVDI